MRKIKLDRWNISQYDDPSPFILESGNLDLQFTLPDANGEALTSFNSGVTINTSTFSVKQV